MSYITNFNQNVVGDTNNSTVLPLNAGLSFVGVATSTLGIVGIQVSMKGDQNCSVYVDQSPGILAGIGTSVTTSGVNLTGILTKFTRDFRIGDQIWVDVQTVRVIDSIASDLALTVSVAFDTNAAGLSFTQHFWDVSDEYTYLASTSKFGITVQAVGSYLRVRITNTSIVNMTYLRFFTALCPIVEAVPRALNEDGNFKTAIYGIEDEYGFEVENTPMGEMRTAQPVRIVGSSYEGNTIDPNFLTFGASGTGAAVTQAGQLVITSGTGNGAQAFAYTNRRGRYIGGTANRYRSVRRTDAGTANNTRRWGIGIGANYALTISSATVVAGDIYSNNNQQFTIRVSGTVTTAYAYGTGNPGAGAQTYTRVSGVGPATLTGSTFAAAYLLTDGAWFQYTDTVFGVRVMAGGSLVTGGNVDTGAFNGVLGATYTPGITALAFEIYYTNTNVYFVIGSELLHTFSLTTGLWTNTVSLHCFSDSLNTGVATSVNMYSRSATIYRLGSLNSENQIRYIAGAATTICKYAPGKLKSVIINYPDAAAQVVSIYDAVSASTGNIIAILTWENSGNQNSMQPNAIPFDIPFHNGLCIVTSTANPVTVIFE
jgi:hypothetical protein